MNTSDVRINVRLTGSDATYFQELLKRKGGSVSHLLREALREYGKNRIVPKPDPAQLLAGFVASGDGPEDLSSNVKRYLREDLEYKLRDGGRSDSDG